MAKSIKDVQSWMEKVGFSEYCKAFEGIFLKNTVEFRLRAFFIFVFGLQIERKKDLIISQDNSTLLLQCFSNVFNTIPGVGRAYFFLWALVFLPNRQSIFVFFNCQDCELSLRLSLTIGFKVLEKVLEYFK